MITAPRQRLRQRQLDQTRELIRRAALDLVAERGFSAVSVQSISEVAGVSPRTFFNHFRTKEEALVPDVPDFTDQQRRDFLRTTDVDLLTALERLLTDHVLRVRGSAGPEGSLHAAARLTRTSPELLPRLLSVFETLERRVADLVAERTGRSPDDLSCTVAADAALSAVRAAMGRRCHDTVRADLPTALPEAFSALRDLARHRSTAS